MSAPPPKFQPSTQAQTTLNAISIRPYIKAKMPLYKITERRLKRKERDEEDGIAILKAALREEMGGGGDETDDEESDSDSDDSSESDEDGDSEDDDVGLPEDEEDASDDDEEGDGELGPSPSDLDDDNDDQDEPDEFSDLEPAQSSDEEEEVGPPPMSISEALSSPIYAGSKRHSKRRGPSSRCVLCPGKVFQFEKPIADHLASAVHQRAVKRYQARLDSEKPIETDDPRELVASIFADLGNNLVREPKEKKAKGKKDKIASSPTTTKLTPSASTPKPSSKAQKRLNKKERKAERAKALLERIGDKSTSDDPPADTTETAAEEASGEPCLKLNRKARRILAQKTKVTNGGAVDGAEEAQGEKGEEQVAKKAKKNRKERMRKNQTAISAVTPDEGQAEKVEKVEKGEKKRKEKRQKKAE